MSSGTLESVARGIARAAIPLDEVEFGPWLGSMRSVSAEQVPTDYMTGGSNFVFVPRLLDGPKGRLYGTFKRRGGQEQKFDTFGGSTGLLPAHWTDDSAPLNAKARWAEEFSSDTLASDGVPTTAWLITKEDMVSGLDDGAFSQFYIRDQSASSNYTLGSEYGSTTYPAPGSEQAYKFVPLWYQSGDGGLTRGTAEFARRFFFCGSRRFLKVGRWHYFPSLLGTPSRALIDRAEGPAAAVNALPTDISGSVNNWKGQDAGTTNLQNYVNEATPSDATYVTETGSSPGTTLTFVMWTAGNIPFSGTPDISVTFRVKKASGAGSETFNFVLYRAAVTVTSQSSGVLGTSFVDYTYSLTSAEVASLYNAGAEGCTIDIFAGAIGATGYDVAQVTIAITDPSPVSANRLIPSGPLPPTHAGTIAAGSVVPGTTATTQTIRPDADVTDGGWLNQAASATNIYQSIDESTTDDTDYISCAALGAACVIGLSDPTATPTSDSSVTVTFRAKTSGSQLLGVALRQASTTIAGTSVSTTTAFANYTLTLTPTQVASITDWTDLRLYFANLAASVFTATVSQAYVTISAEAASISGWLGAHRFYRGMAYRFEDGSVWAVCTPRAANDTLTSGYNLTTVDASNPTTVYSSILWQNIPIGPKGVVSRILLRTQKIDSTSQDTAQLDPYDFRVVWEIKDNTTTEYEDFFAEDDSLTNDTAEAFIRYDHIMPPRARYIFGGDMRVCHSYGGQNPCAIVLAPVGRAADYDLNLPDDEPTAYDSQASFMQIKVDTAGAGTLTLIQGDGATATNTKTFAFSTYDTLQGLVDAINATSFSVDGQQWRAQMCPGANPDASTLSLTPHNRAIVSCVIDNSAKTITRAGGGLSKVAVGQFVSGAAEETGAYVTRIDSDTSLTYTGTLTTGIETLYFYNTLGDSQITDPDTTTLGYQRVIANSLPGFLYFTTDYLDDDPTHKQDVWMTVASPGQAKSAANNFSGRQSNRFAPDDANAGISMGGGAVDQGFITPYSNSVYAIRNTANTGSGIDEDYRQQVINQSEGCCAWGTVGTGNRFVHYLKPTGMYAADLDNEFKLSDYIWRHGSSDAVDGTGDWVYEIPKSIAATAADTDGAYAYARIMRQALWVNYRASQQAEDEVIPAYVGFAFTGRLTSQTAQVYSNALSPEGNPLWLDGSELSSDNGVTAAVDSVIIADGLGSFIVVWTDARSGANDIYAQKYNAAGEEQWTAGGLAVNTQTLSQSLPAVCPDGGGGCIIAWQDGRSGTDDIYAQRITSAGALSWTAAGVVITNAAGNQQKPVICADTEGGAIVAFNDASGATIRAQRIDSSGVVQWTANGVQVGTTGSGLTMCAIPSGSGGMILAYSATGFTAKSQLVDSTGSPQWNSTTGLATLSSLGASAIPAICTDGAGGCYVGSHGTNAIVRRVIAAGTMPFSQVTVSSGTVPGAAGGLVLCDDGDSGCIAVWKQDPTSLHDLRMQRLDGAGAVQWGSGSNLTLTSDAGTVVTPAMTTDGEGGAFIMWYRDSGSGSYDVLAQRVDGDGTALWTPSAGVTLKSAAITNATVSSYASVAGSFVTIPASTNLPDRQLCYDFSAGTTQSGLASLVRPDGEPWGWSNELYRAFSVMVASRRSDGEHLYGWNEANEGGTGDGRIDEFETGDTDNGSEILGSIVGPWFKPDGREVSGQEVLLEHSSPDGSTGALDFTRSYEEDLYPLTPDTSDLVVLRELKLLPQAARVQSPACKLGYRQTTGEAREVRKMTLRAKRVKSYR